MIYYLKIAILALIQGAAELLPVSSSAHVIVAEKLMGFDPSAADMVFLLVMLHTGTMLAVIVYYWRRWKALLVAPSGSGQRYRFDFVKLALLATAITGVLGGAELIVIKLLGTKPETLFKNLPLMAASLFLVGLYIIAAGIFAPSKQLGELNTRSAMLIGLVQGLLLPFRGFSRSGATISTGLFCSLSRALSEDFSFALGVLITPPVQIYSLYNLLKEHKWHLASDVLAIIQPGLVGMVMSFCAGLVALWFLSRVLERGRWKYFGYYCLAAAVVVLAVYYSLEGESSAAPHALAKAVRSL
jgi:undecaprenyl-diphosphatase